jgi:hypothetical protein
VSCSGCNSDHIQNKKYNLCGECVFKKSHGGKSKAEVYQERADKKPKKTYEFKNKKIQQPTSYTIKANIVILGKVIGELKPIDLKYFQDEESRKNEINQNLAELEARRDAKKNGEEFNLAEYEINSGQVEIGNHLHSMFPKKKKKQKAIKQVSEKQAPIERAYKLTCIDMDHTTEPLCTGCGKYQGGDIRLSHSHLISRADCKRIGRPELIYERDNLTYHCMNFGMNQGCHEKWENPIERKTLLDYQKNIDYIKTVNSEMYIKYNA